MGLRLLAPLALLLCLACAPAIRSYQTLSMLQMLERLETTPQEWVVVGESHAKYVKPYVEWVSKRQVMVVETDLSALKVAGLTRITEKGTYIFLEETHGGNMRLHTLVHEIVHVLHGTFLNRQAAEVYAEVVATQVCGQLGLDTRRQTAAYLREWVPMPLQWSVTQRFGEEMDRVVDVLVKVGKDGVK